MLQVRQEKHRFSALSAIGNTPLVQLRRVVPADCAEVFVKLEYFNPTGSYKDRMALAVVEAAEARGELGPGKSVIEYTAGSTGSSLAFVCALKGYPLKVVTSDAFALEKRQMMASFGAELHIVPSDNGQVNPELIPRMRAAAEALAAEHGYFLVNQMRNRDALAGYHGVGEELARQLDRPIDLFCATVGSGAMVLGTAQALQRSHPDIQIVALEPDTSAVLSGGAAGSHRVEGVGVGFVPPVLENAVPNRVLPVSEKRTREMAQRLAREEGIFAGTSSGMNVVGALALARELGPGKTVVTVAVDSGMKYLASDLYPL